MLMLALALVSKNLMPCSLAICGEERQTAGRVRTTRVRRSSPKIKRLILWAEHRSGIAGVSKHTHTHTHTHIHFHSSQLGVCVCVCVCVCVSRSVSDVAKSADRLLVWCDELELLKAPHAHTDVFTCSGWLDLRPGWNWAALYRRFYQVTKTLYANRGHVQKVTSPSAEYTTVTPP